MSATITSAWTCRGCLGQRPREMISYCVPMSEGLAHRSRSFAKHKDGVGKKGMFSRGGQGTGTRTKRAWGGTECDREARAGGDGTVPFSIASSLAFRSPFTVARSMESPVHDGCIRGWAQERRGTRS